MSNCKLSVYILVHELRNAKASVIIKYHVPTFATRQSDIGTLNLGHSCNDLILQYTQRDVHISREHHIAHGFKPMCQKVPLLSGW